MSFKMYQIMMINNLAIKLLACGGWQDFSFFYFIYLFILNVSHSTRIPLPTMAMTNNH